MRIQTKLSKMIRSTREAHLKETQGQFAERFRNPNGKPISAYTVGKWEGGTSRPGPRHFKAMAKTLDLSLEDFVDLLVEYEPN